ncbi:MAG: hypothetical protein NUW01_09060 [Gemmatimonadaceae bacterium]|nr:hypothetical protein [Gemmatimonadaceae bacterium]
MSAIEETGLTTEQQEWLDGLREMADWFEQHPERIEQLGDRGIIVNLYPDGKGDTAQLARELGKVTKEQNSSLFWIRRGFGPHKIDGVLSRGEVCTRVVTGTRQVPEKIVPAYEEEIIEWECVEPLLASVKS